MSVLSTKKRLAAAAMTTAILVGGGGAAAFAAASGVPAATIGSANLAASSSPARVPHHAHHARHAHQAKGLLARSDHATVEIKQHGHWVTITLDRGKVTAVSATSITLARPDGQSTTIPLTASTRYRGVATSAATVQKGRRATVVSEAGTARTVMEAKLRPGHHKARKSASPAPTVRAA